MADPTYLRYLAACEAAKAQQWTDSGVYVEPAPRPLSSAAALEHAAESITRLRRRGQHDGAIDACDLSLHLAQVDQVLTACLRSATRSAR